MDIFDFSSFEFLQALLFDGRIQRSENKGVKKKKEKEYSMINQYKSIGKSKLEAIFNSTIFIVLSRLKGAQLRYFELFWPGTKLLYTEGNQKIVVN